MIAKTPMHTLLIALATVMSVGGAQAANFSKATYEAAKDDIKTRYKAEREACDKQSANAKDICVETAKGNEKIALAQLEYNYSGDARDDTKLREVKYNVRYDIAKEKCDDLSGNAKDVCVREAKTTHDKAKADAKLTKKAAEAVEDAEETRLKADYKLAAEKCEAYSGDKKDVCVASAKAQYHQRW